MSQVSSLFRSSIFTTLFLAGMALLLVPAAQASSTWEVTPAPHPGSSECVVKGVAVISADQAWAVGTYQSASGENRSLILRYAAGTWGVSQSPNPETACTDGNVMWGGNGAT